MKLKSSAPERIFLVCANFSTSGSVWLNVEEAHEEAKMLTQSEGVTWRVFAFNRASPLPFLSLRAGQEKAK